MAGAFEDVVQGRELAAGQRLPGLVGSQRLVGTEAGGGLAAERRWFDHGHLAHASAAQDLQHELADGAAADDGDPVADLGG